MQLKKDKRIGKVLFIVEGSKHEFSLIKKIFGDILGYIFDRDPMSNTNVRLISDLLQTLKNPRENDDNMQGGILLLSYPSIEAYEVSNFVDESYKIYKKTGGDVKAYINQNAKEIAMNKINEASISHAYIEMEQGIEELLGTAIDIDDFIDINIGMFNVEEQYFKKSDTYFLLSMMSYILLDLGILQKGAEL